MYMLIFELQFNEKKVNIIDFLQMCLVKKVVVCIIVCPETFSLTTLPVHTSCTLSPYCSGVTCCTDIALLGMTLQTEVKLDRCQGKLHLAIENHKMATALHQLQFSSWQMFTLRNVFRLK